MKQSDILDYLISTNEYISGQALADKLGVSRQAVWKEIGMLREQGYEIESVTKRGYRLTGLPGYLNAPAVKTGLHTKHIGKELTVLDSVGSTNDFIKQMGEAGCKSGAVVAAREQLKGKGRLGREWRSDKDECLAFSVLLRPKMAPSEVSSVTPLAGLAVCKALRGFTGLDCKIKWPNDVIVGRKKLCGILTEMCAEFDAVEYIITGIGINVSQAVFPEDIAFKATSLLLETGRLYDKNKLLACVLDSLESEFLRGSLTLTRDALEEYADLCATIGKNVTFRRGTRRISGMAVGLSDSGELRVMLSDGSVCTVNSGEVTAQGIY